VSALTWAARSPLLILSCALLACQTVPEPREPKAPPAEVVAPPAPRPDPKPPEGLRLPATSRPLRYEAELTVDPARDTFSGAIRIDVEVSSATEVLWLNGRKLKVHKAQVEQGSTSVDAAVIDRHEGLLGLVLPRPLGPGPATLRLVYEGVVSSTDWGGLFRQQEGGAWYTFTNFEPLDARAAFPCYDDPALKVPWKLSLHVPAGLVALSNTPAESEAKGAEGMKWVRFKETPPLPSYLVAVAVGPFSLVDAGVAGSRRTPLRVAALQGEGEQAALAARMVAPLLERLEGYFGVPFPYDKLDLVAVPTFFGGMENVGLITMRNDAIRASRSEETPARERAVAALMAHEIAHQWFGDLVTMKWWDDLWLNESFADWAEQEVLQAWRPEWEREITRVSGTRGAAMRADAQVSARTVRQRIDSHGDIVTAFDSITYAKGAEVLEMMEAWVGPERWRAAVHRYLEAHRFRNTTAEDFFAAISAEAGRDVAPVFSSFIDQGGTPLVSVKLRCEGGSARLLLSQRRYLPVGAAAPGPQTWRVPVCVRYGKDRPAGRACTLLESAEGELPLEGGCPTWVVPNDGMTGYYRSNLDAPLRRALLGPARRQLSMAEQVGLLGDLNALVRSGDLPAGEALALAPDAVKSGNRHLAVASMGLVLSVKENLVPEALRPNYARLINRLYSKRAHELGFNPAKGEDENTKLLRPQLLGLVGDEGGDQALRREARRLAEAWLKDRTTLPADLVDTVMYLSVLDGDAAYHQRLLEAARGEKDRRDRERLLSALAGFRDRALVERNLEIFMEPQGFDARDAMGLLFGGASEPATREITFRYIRDHWDRISERLPTTARPFLLHVAGGFCDRAKVQEVEAGFGPIAAKVSGGDRVLRSVVERIQTCAAFKERQQPSVAAFLKRY
jgi:alanyl aminopeptidase